MAQPINPADDLSDIEIDIDENNENSNIQSVMDNYTVLPFRSIFDSGHANPIPISNPNGGPDFTYNFASYVSNALNANDITGATTAIGNIYDMIGGPNEDEEEEEDYNDNDESINPVVPNNNNSNSENNSDIDIIQPNEYGFFEGVFPNIDINGVEYDADANVKKDAKENIPYNNNLYGNYHNLITNFANHDNIMDLSRWIKDTDTTILELEDNDVMIEINSVECLFDTPQIIMSLFDDIPEVPQAFTNSFTQITTNFIEKYMGQNNFIWNIDVIERYKMIALYIAITSAPQLIAPLVNSIGIENVMVFVDNHGLSVMKLACSNIDSLIVLLTNYPQLQNYLFAENEKNTVIPIEILLYNGGIISLIDAKVLDLDTVLKFKNKWNMTALHIGSMTDFGATRVLLERNIIPKEYHYETDNNGSIPLYIAGIFGSKLTLDAFINTGIYTQDILNVKNKGNHTISGILTYGTHIVSALLRKGCLSKEYIINNKLYLKVNKHNCLHFLEIFTSEDLMTELIVFNNFHVYKKLIDIIFASLDVFKKVIECTDEKIVALLKDVFTKLNFSLPRLAFISLDMYMVYLNSQYVNDKDFTDKYQDQTIADITTVDHDTIYLEPLIKCQKYKILDEKIELLTRWLNNMNLSDIILNRLSNDEKKALLTKLLDNNKIQLICNLVNSDKIPIECLQGNTDLIYGIITDNVQCLEYALTNNLIDINVIQKFVIDGVVILNFHYIIEVNNDDMYDNQFERFIKLIPLELLNAKNDHYATGSIIQSIESPSQLQILLNIEGFDNSLLFRHFNGRNHLTEAIHRNLTSIVQYMLQHPLFTQDEYDFIFEHFEPFGYFTYTAGKDIAKMILLHKFMSDKVINKYGRDIVDYCIEQEYPTYEVVKIVTKLDQESMIKKTNDLNLLELAYSRNYHELVDMILELPTFTKELLTQNFYDIMIKTPYIPAIKKIMQLDNDLGSNDLLIRSLFSNKINIKEIEDVVDLKKFSHCVDDVILHYNFNIIKYVLDLIEYHNPHILHKIVSRDDKISIKILNYIIDNNPTLKIVKLVNDKNTSETNESLILYINAEITKLIIKSEYCNVYLSIINNYIPIKTLFSDIDNDGQPVYFAVINNPEIDPYYYDKESLMMKDKNGYSLIQRIIELKYNKLFTILLKCDIIDDKIITDNIVQIVMFNEEITKNLIMMRDIQLTQEQFINCMTRCIELQSKNIAILKQSSSYKAEYIDSIDQNMLLTISKTYIGLKYLYDNELVTNDLLKMNNYELIKSVNNPQYLKHIMKTIKDIEILKECNMITKLVEFPHLITLCPQELLIEDGTFIFKLIDNKFNDDIRKVLDIFEANNKLTEILQLKYNGSIVLDHCMDILKDELKHRKYRAVFTPDILVHESNKIQMISKLTKYVDLKTFKKLTTKYINDDQINKAQLLEFATINSVEIMEWLLATINYDIQTVTKCFVVACRHNSESLNKLINNPDIKFDVDSAYDKIIIDGEAYNANYLQIAILYNIESLRILLESEKVNILNALNDDNIDNPEFRFNALILATLYEPDALELLLKHKYVTVELLTNSGNLCKKNLFLLACENQIASATLIRESKYKYLYEDYNDQYVMLTSIAWNNYHGGMNQQQNQNRIRYLRVKDINVEDEALACTICFTRKPRLLFVSCGHKACISCSLRITNCNTCRSQIMDRIICD